MPCRSSASARESSHPTARGTLRSLASRGNSLLQHRAPAPHRHRGFERHPPEPVPGGGSTAPNDGFGRPRIANTLPLQVSPRPLQRTAFPCLRSAHSGCAPLAIRSKPCPLPLPRASENPSRTHPGWTTGTVGQTSGQPLPDGAATVGHPLRDQRLEDHGPQYRARDGLSPATP